MLDVKLDDKQKQRYQTLVNTLHHDDRYEELVSIRKHPQYKDTYIVNEIDKDKGSRISQVNSQFDANIRTDKYDKRGAKI